ncbi:hypothetical protein AMTR_s00077p00172030 [Amborella trichopoda]|uniref:Uncharacterized protein n=1 Tax=Amborella trichopoda TaxID=13333 RepID=W1P8N8_AMBTC|nr:hypothetical protein AMTR_s00077p00172030 [Amborella trichopoda]
MLKRYHLQNMHCQSSCVSIARAMSLECQSALCNCWSIVAPKHVLSERIVSRMCTVRVPSATARALCLQCRSALCNCRSVVAPGIYYRSAL